MADTFFVPLAERLVVVQGKASARVRQLVSRGLPEKWPNNSVLLFLEYSNMEAPVGQTFHIIFEINSPHQHVESECRIVAVTQDFAKAFDSIPRGWKTISIFEFPGGIPEIIHELPTLDSWGGDHSIGLASSETWSLITEPPTTERWKSEKLWRYTPLRLKQYYFTCPRCRQCVDAGYRWAYWNLQKTLVVTAEEPVCVEKLLGADGYWNFSSRDDRRDQLTAESLANVRRFIEEHKGHEVLYQAWGKFTNYKELES